MDEQEEQDDREYVEGFAKGMERVEEEEVGWDVRSV